MEYRVRFAVCYMGMLMLIFSYNMRFHLADIKLVLLGGLIGFFLLWNFNFNASVRPRPIIDHLVFHKPLASGISAISTLFSWDHHKFSWILGITVGFYMGYIFSVAYNAYYSLPYLYSIPVISACIGSIVAYGFVTAMEQVRGLRVYGLPYYDDIEETWSINTLIQSVLLCYSVGEFGGLFGAIYAIFFEVVYYYVYIGFTQYFYASLGIFALFWVYNTISYVYQRRSNRCCKEVEKKPEQLPLPFRI